jgi:hypothetical protein
MLFQTLDALAHRAMSDVHFICGVREIQVPGSRFEEAKRLEWRKCARHVAMIAALTIDVRNDRWQSSCQHRIIQVPGAHRCERSSDRSGRSDVLQNDILASVEHPNS